MEKLISGLLLFISIAFNVNASNSIDVKGMNRTYSDNDTISIILTNHCDSLLSFAISVEMLNDSVARVIDEDIFQEMPVKSCKYLIIAPNTSRNIIIPIRRYNFKSLKNENNDLSCRLKILCYENKEYVYKQFNVKF